GSIMGRNQGLTSYIEVIRGKTYEERFGVDRAREIRQHLSELKLSRESVSRFDSTRYKIWRRTILERDEYTCQECGKSPVNIVHHKEPWASNEDVRLDIDNGITLCRPCHAREHVK